MTFANQIALRDVCVKHKPTSYLEVGVWRGWSLAVVLDNAPIERLALCDAWSKEWSATEALPDHSHIKAMLDARRYAGVVQWLDGDSMEMLPRLFGVQYDLAHVDGCHREPWVTSDLRECWRLLRTGGHLVVDDLTHAPVIRASLDKFLAGVRHEVVLIDTTTPDGVAVIRKW